MNDYSRQFTTAVMFPPCQCGRAALVAIGDMAWCYRHVAEAIRLLERMAEVSR